MNGTQLRLGLERLTSRSTCSYHEFSVMARTNPISEISAEFCPSRREGDEYIRLRAKGASFSLLYDLPNLREIKKGPLKGTYEIRWKDENRAKVTANRLLKSLARRSRYDEKPATFYIEKRSGFLAVPILI